MSDTESADVRVFERPADGFTEVIAAKLHGIRVTESKLNYHGSITIDADILEAAHMLPLEFVYIWNKATGARISTYVLPGKRGSGVCCLNGGRRRAHRDLFVPAAGQRPHGRLQRRPARRHVQPRSAGQRRVRSARLPRERGERRHALQHGKSRLIFFRPVNVKSPAAYAPQGSFLSYRVFV